MRHVKIASFWLEEWKKGKNAKRRTKELRLTANNPEKEKKKTAVKIIIMGNSIVL